MLRKFLISTVIVSILILLTTLTITVAEASSVTPLISSAATTLPTELTTTANTATAPSTATVSNSSATVLQLTRTSVVNKFLNNAAAEETTTSVLPLQPPLNVTSTTLASLILNQKNQQQQRQRKQQQQLYLKQQRQYRQLQRAEERPKQQNQPQQQQLQTHEQFLNANVKDNREIKKKNLDDAFVTLKSSVDVITPEPSSTHAYIPFDLDYNDPTEEKGAHQATARQSTINEVLTNLFPKGFSDIFRFSYAGEEQPIPPIQTTTDFPLNMRRSTPTAFKRMPSSTKITRKANTEKPPNATLITVSTTVTREMRREISPGHTEIVVEKIITDPAARRSSEDFKDGSNSISRDELLRINRAAKEASVLPSLLVKPLKNSSDNLNETRSQEPIVILNETNNNDDFVDAPEDDNQIAETQDVVQEIVQAPPAESSNFHVTPSHQYNVHIIHDNTLKNTPDNIVNIPDISPKGSQAKDFSLGRSSPSYQTFVQQSKYLQNSLKEAPSRKFLKTFQEHILSDSNNPAPIAKGNFHYEQLGQQNHIQAVAPAAQYQFVQYHAGQPHAEAFHKEQPTQQKQYQQQLHTHITSSQHLRDNDFYKVDPHQQELQHTTPANLIFVTLNTNIAHASPQSAKLVQTYENEEPHTIPAQPMKSPHEFVSDAMGYASHDQQLDDDHQAEQTENSPKPSDGGGSYTFVEVQKSINIHNKLITEKDGRLIEQHETIYPEPKYTVQQNHEQEQPNPSPDYVSLSQNPIHVEQEEEPYESAASVRDEQHTLNPAQDLEEFGTIQQSNLVQETHIIETQQQQDVEQQEYHDEPPEQEHQEVYVLNQQEQSVNPQHQVQEEEQHLTGEILPSQQPANIPQTPLVQIPYALPAEQLYQQPPSPTPVAVQGIVEKHIPVPYGVPEPVGYPVHIQHFIDRPYPIETIVEKPMPYPVQTIVEKIVEKHVPVEVEKIVEKPVEVIVKKYINRPVAIPIKIPVALHLPNAPPGPATYGPPGTHYPPGFGGGLDHASTWPQPVGGGSFTRIPQNILKAYYVKMLKKLVPQMHQAYKTAHVGRALPKITQKPNIKPKYKISDMLYDLKPPPQRFQAGGSTWDMGARYQYDYNTLPIDLSASSSMAVGKTLERPGGQGYKTNFDEFQRWRNGHSLKRSPDFGRNLHMEYGFKPPLVPSVEIDDKGVPLKAVADLAKGKPE